MADMVSVSKFLAEEAAHGFVPCAVMPLPETFQRLADAAAIEMNPANKAGVPSGPVAAPHIAAVTSKFWGASGVRLTVGFMDNPARSLADKILSHMNAWGQQANVVFTLISNWGDAAVRISRGQGGYWSYIGTDIRMVPRNQQTMNLQGFSESTPEAEFFRVVRHETGHTLGFPHEHMRRQVVSQLDEQKTIAYFQRLYGWPPSMTMQQVLTPLDESTLTATPAADEDSIMCYSLPGSITKDGQPIQGGDDINATDHDFVSKLYPKAVTPAPPTEPQPPQGPLEEQHYLLTVKGRQIVAVTLAATGGQDGSNP